MVFVISNMYVVLPMSYRVSKKLINGNNAKVLVLKQFNKANAFASCPQCKCQH